RTERFQRLQNSYVFKQPERLYEGQTIKLDRMTQRLFQAMTTIQHQKQRQAQGIIAQLQQQTPKGQLRESQQQLAFLQRNLQTQMTQLFLNKQKQFTSAVQQLDLLSPLKIMGRG
ncbi:exodeoxyribonuclease VII large subunit, partial [Acinetobacter baumannii]|uniref:exodeoxyribonuclease VII large subunit n=1 Tax=Acinetobacter baumannii TaxID=470 RepID=UPI001BC871A1